MIGTIPDDLSIPACIDLRNADVAAKRERDRQAPITAMPAFVERQRDMDEETRKFWEAEKAREAIEKKNGLGAFNEKKKAHKAGVLGGRYDSRHNRWVTPEEDFAAMAERARRPDGSTVTVDELREYFRNGSAWARGVLAQIDTGKLALEAEKALERMKRRNKRRAKAETLATVVPFPRRRA